ncbi:hypothetical protein DYB31_009018, partial [Aphanomyces astaci]
GDLSVPPGTVLRLGRLDAFLAPQFALVPRQLLHGISSLQLFLFQLQLRFSMQIGLGNRILSSPSYFHLSLLVRVDFDQDITNERRRYFVRRHAKCFPFFKSKKCRSLARRGLGLCPLVLVLLPPHFEVQACQPPPKHALKARCGCDLHLPFLHVCEFLSLSLASGGILLTIFRSVLKLVDFLFPTEG